MEDNILRDPAIEPTNELIFSHIGDKEILWHELLAHLHDTYTDVEEVWRFYKDGNRWLFRTIRKKQTIFWVNVQEGYFKVAFYIKQSAEQKIMEGDFAEEAKVAYQEARKIAQSRELVIDMHSKDDLELVKKVVAMRMKIK